MSTINVIVLLLASITSVIATVLVFHKDYEDGIIGRFALSLIAIAGVGRVVGIMESEFSYSVSPQGAMIWAGMAIFFSRHLYRFLRWKHHGTYEWREIDK